jgi:hypothetical protein
MAQIIGANNARKNNAYNRKNKLKKIISNSAFNTSKKSTPKSKLTKLQKQKVKSSVDYKKQKTAIGKWFKD